MSKRNKHKPNNGSVTAPVAKSEAPADEWEDLDDELSEDAGEEDAEEEEFEEEMDATEPAADADAEDDEVADDSDDDAADAEDDAADDDADVEFYTVVNPVTVGDQQFEPGQKIKVACRHCALWQQPLAAYGGKTLCRPGTKVKWENAKGETVEWEMAANRHSCRRFFLPVDIAEAKEFLVDDPHAVAVLKLSFSVAAAIVKAQNKFATYAERHKLDDAVADKLLATVNDFAQLFTSEEQIAHVRPLIPYLVAKLRAKYQLRATTKRALFNKGDEVAWTDRTSGEEVTGFIRTIGGPKKEVALIVTGDSAAVLRPKFVAAKRKENPKARITFTVSYDVKAWIDERSPRVISEAVAYDVPEEE